MSGTFYGCYLLRPVILRRLIWATPASKMQLDEFSIVPQNTHQPAHPFRYLVLVFKIFLTRLEAQHLDTWLHACSPTSHAAGHYHTATQKSTTWLLGPHCLPQDYSGKKLVPLDYSSIEIVPHHYPRVATILLAYRSVPVLPRRYQPDHNICNSVKPSKAAD